MPRSRARRCWRALALAVALTTLGACRIDTTVDVVLDSDGSGTVTLTAVADPEVVEAAPGLAGDLRLDDLTAAGWVTDGATPTEDGGLRLVATHPFATPAEATAVLAQLSDEGGPFRDLLVDQVHSFARLTSSVTGTIALAEGLSSFADAEVVELIGGEPYLDTLEDRGVPLGDAFSLRLSVTTPGSLVETNGAATAEDGAVTGVWYADLVGEAASSEGMPVLLDTVESDRKADWASRLEQFAPWALAAWGAFMIGVVLPVVGLRRRRRARRAHR